MTWEELAEKIAQMTEEQRQQNVTVCFEDEFYGNMKLKCTGNEDDVLDANSPYLLHFL